MPRYAVKLNRRDGGWYFPVDLRESGEASTAALCFKALAHYYHIPKACKKIYLVVSSDPMSSAHKMRMNTKGAFAPFVQILTYGKRTRSEYLYPEFRRRVVNKFRLNEGEWWVRVEYE